MIVQYEVYLDDDRGNRLANLDTLSSLEMVKGVDQAGRFSLAIAGLDEKLLRRDRILEIWRKPGSGQNALLFVGFLRRWKFEGRETTTLAGPGIGALLERRIVAYAAGSAYAEKTDYADDMMKEVIRENLGSSTTDSDRNWTALGLAVDPDYGLGPSITKGFSRKNVMETLKGIAETARQAGTDVYFDLLPEFSGSTLAPRFVTYINQPGIDRTIDGGNRPALFGMEFGNLTAPVLEYDYEDEVSVVYAGGQGTEAARTVVEVEDTARTGGSAWGRIEAWADARNQGSSDGVTAAANEKLQDKRGKVRFVGTILDSDQARFGVDWNLGDLATAQYRGFDFDGMIRTLKINVSNEGVETIAANIEVSE